MFGVGCRLRLSGTFETREVSYQTDAQMAKQNWRRAEAASTPWGPADSDPVL